MRASGVTPGAFYKFKTMATTTIETVTSFYYTIATLIDRVNLGVLYKVRRRGEVLGLGEDSIIDAEILVKEYLGSISHEIFSKFLSPLGRELEDLDTPLEPFEFDETFVNPDTDAETENCIIYRAIFPDKFDNTTVISIHKAMEDALVSYCIWQWLMDSNIQGWEKYEMEHTRKFDDLLSLVVRRVNLKRTYKLY